MKRKPSIACGTLVVVCLVMATASEGQPVTAGTSRAVEAVVPVGYKVQKIVPSGGQSAGAPEYLVGLSDADAKTDADVPSRTAMLLLVKLSARAVVEDRLALHADTKIGEEAVPANCLNRLTREIVDGRPLWFVSSANWYGGSGSWHYFDLFDVADGKLKLVRTFQHARMERLYFALYGHSIYDSELKCSRGEKHGNAYVYTCYLDVSKYQFDGKQIVPIASERWMERQGNRFLNEKYWVMSILPALRKGQIFTHPPDK